MAEKKAPRTLAKRIEKSKSRTSKSYLLDLKIHRPSSLVGLGDLPGIDPAPALVRLALVKGLDIIAVSDRNNASFVDGLKKASLRSKLTVIPGVEIRAATPSCDEVILTCLFPESYEECNIRQFLDRIGVPPSAAGDRDFIAPYSLHFILGQLEIIGAAAFPTQVDKTPKRLVALKDLVEIYGFRVFDLSYADSGKYFLKNWPDIEFSLFSFSNANALAQIGSRYAKVNLSLPGFAGVKNLVGRVPSLYN
jgi:hypothetical protein